MNKVCKEYISDAKKFFPVMGRKERDYLRKVSGDIEDFIEVENITTKSELVEKYHQPYEVANNYYATFFDTELIIKRIKISKYIKTFISILIIVTLIGFSFYMYVWNNHRIMALREEMVDSVEIKKDDSKSEAEKYSVHNEIKDDDFIEDEEEIIE
jgi:hypothetical protein